MSVPALSFPAAATAAIVYVVAPFLATLAAPAADIARHVKSDLVLLSRPHVSSSGSSAPFDPNPPSSSGQSLPLGEALDLFYRYGFFSLSVRVVPRDDAGSWLVREPTAEIFERPSVRVEELRQSGQFEQNLQIFFCDDEAELFEAYFRDFTAENIQEPHRLFTGSWHPSTKSKYLGLPKSAFDGDSAFVLVRLPKKSVLSRVADPRRLRLKGPVAAAAAAIAPGNEAAVKAFTEDYGSHYVRSVTVGDVVYQVFALAGDAYAQAKRAHAHARFMDAAAYQRLYQDFLAPWTVRETGKVLVASGDRAAASFVGENLVERGQFGESPNIFRLVEQPAVMAGLERAAAGSEAVVGMDFGALNAFVPDAAARGYYDAVMSNQAGLWASNIKK